MHITAEQIDSEIVSVLTVYPAEQATAAEAARLQGGVEPWVADVLEEAAMADTDARSVELKGTVARRLVMALDEAAEGRMYTPDFQPVAVPPELQTAARRVLGRVPLGEAIAGPATPDAIDLSPALPDRLVITGVHRIIDTLSHLIHRSGSEAGDESAAA